MKTYKFVNKEYAPSMADKIVIIAKNEKDAIKFLTDEYGVKFLKDWEMTDVSDTEGIIVTAYHCC